MTAAAARPRATAGQQLSCSGFGVGHPRDSRRGREPKRRHQRGVLRCAAHDLCRIDYACRHEVLAGRRRGGEALILFHRLHLRHHPALPHCRYLLYCSWAIVSQVRRAPLFQNAHSAGDHQGSKRGRRQRRPGTPSRSGTATHQPSAHAAAFLVKLDQVVTARLLIPLTDATQAPTLVPQDDCH